MNQQPYYHRAVVLFTATHEFTRDELTALLAKKLRAKGLVPGTAECEEVDAEPGDPADLIA